MLAEAALVMEAKAAAAVAEVAAVAAKVAAAVAEVAAVAAKAAAVVAEAAAVIAKVAAVVVAEAKAAALFAELETSVVGGGIGYIYCGCGSLHERKIFGYIMEKNLRPWEKKGSREKV